MSSIGMRCAQPADGFGSDPKSACPVGLRPRVDEVLAAAPGLVLASILLASATPAGSLLRLMPSRRCTGALSSGARLPKATVSTGATMVSAVLRSIARMTARATCCGVQVRKPGGRVAPLELVRHEHRRTQIHRDRVVQACDTEVSEVPICWYGGVGHEDIDGSSLADNSRKAFGFGQVGGDGFGAQLIGEGA